jgi:predicted transcriptional regulator
MEDNKQTSEYVYEDEFVFLTNNNELFLKEDWEGNEKKLCEVNPDDLEDKIVQFKEAYAELKDTITQKLAESDVGTDLLSSLEDQVKNSTLIGNIGLLKEQIQQGRKSLEEEPEPTEESGQPEKTENNQEQEVGADQEHATNGAADSDNQQEQNEEEVDEKADREQEEMTEGSDDTIDYYREIVDKAQDLAKQSDWPYVSMELDNLSHEWSEGPDLESDQVKKLYQKFTDAVENFEQRKEEHYEKLDKQKQENLETKQKLLEEFEGIVSNETWTATRRVNQMKGQWNSTGPLPSGKGEELDERFEELLDIFNDHKVDRLVQQRQKEEDNLMLKLAVLEKMENLAGSIDHTTENWKEIDEKFDDLTKQWKKIGRVPNEKSNEVWGRYKSAQDEYYDQKYKHDPEHQSKVDKFYHKKEKICEEAEELLEADDIASAAREINRLHRRWKKVGNLPQRDEDKLWARFKSATDEFNERKSNNQDKIRKQEEEHYQQKLELIDKANEVKHTDDFEKGHSQMQSFMDRWKKIGPVPRKKSDKIWKKFKGAMDEFYDRRREHFKEVKEERKENLEEKKEILEKLRELGKHEDPIEAVDIAKGLQEKFKDVGYVPIKHKNEMWKKYREACDVIYDRMRAAKSGDKFDQELAKADLEPEDRNKIQKLRKEYNKIKKEAKKLEKEVLQYKEKKTYFKPSDGGNALLDEVENKIEKVEEKLDKKHQKMENITDEMEEIRAESGE